MIDSRLGGRAGDWARLSTAMLLLVGLAGCSNSVPLDPLKSDGAVATFGADAAAGGFGSAAFYPLALDNTWNYEGTFRLTFVEDPEASPWGDPVEIQNVETDRIIGTEVIDGVTYFVREEVLNQGPEPYTGQYVSWSRMRQDRSGLFAAVVNVDVSPTLQTSTARYAAPSATRGRPTVDVSVLEKHGLSKADAAAFAARIERLRDAARGWSRPADAKLASQEGELTWLLYPLHIGVEWSLLPDISWPARVDRVEVLTSKMGPVVAYRIETQPLGIPLPEGEYVRLFYGRAGFIGYSIHSSFQATDQDGNPIGTAMVDETRMLVSTGPNS